MFSYFLSVAVAFIVFGVINNIFKRVNPDWHYRNNVDGGLDWYIITISSLIWFVAIPFVGILFIVYLLKLLTDKLADVILSRIKNKGGK